MNLLAVSGSVRKGSYNLAFLRAMKERCPKNSSVSVYGQIKEIPTFDPDIDEDTPAGSLATRKVLPYCFNVFFPGANSRLAISVSVFRSLWFAVNQFAVPASSVCRPHISGQRCVTWS